MTPQLWLGDLAPPRMWVHIPVEDPRAAAFYDDHYSRQTVGAKGLMGPGRRFLLWHEVAGGNALWGINYALDPVGAYQFRNVIFRNVSPTRSSELIRAATVETFALWERRYKRLPDEPLITEIGIAETAARRSRRSIPGACYAHAGWEMLRLVPKAHGRSAKAIYTQRGSDPWEAFARQWLLIGSWMLIDQPARITSR